MERLTQLAQGWSNGKLVADMEAAFDAEKSSVHGDYEEGKLTD